MIQTYSRHLCDNCFQLIHVFCQLQHSIHSMTWLLRSSSESSIGQADESMSLVLNCVSLSIMALSATQSLSMHVLPSQSPVGHIAPSVRRRKFPLHVDADCVFVWPSAIHPNMRHAFQAAFVIVGIKVFNRFDKLDFSHFTQRNACQHSLRMKLYSLWAPYKYVSY